MMQADMKWTALWIWPQFTETYDEWLEENGYYFKLYNSYLYWDDIKNIRNKKTSFKI
jgi:hypothetical protein